MNEFLKEVLEKADELSNASGFQAVMCVHEIEKAYEQHVAELRETIKEEVEQWIGLRKLPGYVDQSRKKEAEKITALEAHEKKVLKQEQEMQAPTPAPKIFGNKGVTIIANTTDYICLEKLPDFTAGIAMQQLKIITQNTKKGKQLVLTTNRWTVDSLDELDAIIDFAKNRMKQ